MALSEAQKVSLFEILEVPMVNKVRKFVDPDNLLIQNTVALADSPEFLAVEQIDLFLTDLAANYSERETILKGYLDKWEYLEVDTTVIADGSVGAIGGVTIDPDRERQQIAIKVRTIVPFYRKHDQMSQSAKSNPQVSAIR